MTWEEIKKKYPDDRERMSKERETAFVNDCFSCYEEEGFAKKFWTPYDDHKDRIGQAFEVICRCTIQDCDLCTLPMWTIRFSDGISISAHPEEIVPIERKHNGCNFEN